MKSNTFVCLGLLLALAMIRTSAQSAEPTITWLPLTQASPTSKIAELRRDILTFFEPARRRLFGEPDTILTTAYFIRISGSGRDKNVFPTATSTNVDGTLACGLSPQQFKSYHQRIQTTDGAEQFASPRVGAAEGARATLSVQGRVQIGGTNAVYGQVVDLVHHVSGNNVQIRVLADVSQPSTNVVASADQATASELVTITTLFQTALDTTVPSGGGVAVWAEPAKENQKTYLLLINPVIQTPASMQQLFKAPAGDPNGLGSQQ